jgi:acetyl esterase/lipase
MAATLIDPEIVAGMAAIGMSAEPQPGPPPSMELVNLMRSQQAAVPYDPTPAEGVTREERTIVGGPGQVDVPIRIFRRVARDAAPAPAVLWMHGGGYIVGSHDMDARVLDQFVLATGCVAVSVQYRLAPETPYPGALEDCYAALSFLASGGDQLGVDPSRVAVAGRSAGAGLAAAVTLLARDRGLPIVHQHLLYPMLDDTQSTPSSGWPDPVWSAAMSTFGWQSYLGELYRTDEIPPYAAPARVEDLTGLPPAYIHIGARDAFLYEGITYASRLLESGVPTELHVLPDAPHAFDVVAADASISRIASSLSEAALGRALTFGSHKTERCA